MRRLIFLRVRRELGEFGTVAGIAVDSNGRIIVTDSGNDRVSIFEPDGTFVTLIDSSNAGLGGQRGRLIDVAVTRICADMGGCSIGC